MDGVGAVGGEAAGRELVRPVACGEGRVVPDFGGAGEGGAVPVVAGALPDGDLDLGHARAGAVAVGAAEAAVGAAGVPLCRRVALGVGREGRGRAWGRRVDRPGEGRRRRIRVARHVGRPHVERVAAIGQADVAVGARARVPGATVAPALERRPRLTRRELEVSVVEGGRVGRRHVDGRLRRGRVVGERAARGALDVARDVGGAHADGVVIVGGEVGGVEGVGPVARGESRVVPDFGGAREGGAVPVVARAAADGDLDLGDPGRGVGVGAAQPFSRAACGPARRVVAAGGRREAGGRARRRRVVREGGARRGLDVARVVSGADANRVRAVRREVGGVEVVRPVAAREGGVVPNFSGAGEAAAVPVVAGAAADGDLDVHDAHAGVGVGAAEAGCRAARVPFGGRVAAGVRRERRRGRGGDGVDRPVESCGVAVGVARRIGGADLEGVAAVGEAGVGLRARAR